MNLPSLQAQTPLVAEGFLFVEQPLVTSLCPFCQQTIKTGLSPINDLVSLKCGYQISTIRILKGRSFEKVRIGYQHNCKGVDL